MHDLVTLGEVMLRLAIPSPARIETVQPARRSDRRGRGQRGGGVCAAGAGYGLDLGAARQPWGDRIAARADGARSGLRVRTLDGRRPDGPLLHRVRCGAAPGPGPLRPARFGVRASDRRGGRLGAGATGPACPPDRDHAGAGPGPRGCVERALREASQLSFDVNYRATLWAPAEARAFAESVLPRARYFFLGEAEARILFNLTGSAEATLEALARLAPKATIALLQGPEGSTVLDGGRLWRPSRQYTVQMVDPVGAGDAYVAGFLWAALSGRGLPGGGRCGRSGGRAQVLDVGGHRA